MLKINNIMLKFFFMIIISLSLCTFPIYLYSHKKSSDKLTPWKTEWRCLVLNIRKGYGWEYTAPYNGPDTHSGVRNFMKFLVKKFHGVVYTSDEYELEKLERLTTSVYETLQKNNPATKFTRDGDLMKFMIKVDLAERAARADKKYYIENIDTNFIRKTIPEVFMKIAKDKKLDLSTEEKIISHYTDFLLWSYGKTIDKFFNSLAQHLKDTVAAEGTPLSILIRNMSKEKSKYYK